MSGKSLLILNGKSAARPEIRSGIMDLQKRYPLEVWVPWIDSQMHDVLHNAVVKERRVDRVIAGGGDGTVNVVANALLELEIADKVDMGVMPLGTANDFARAFGDLGNDPIRSLEHALTGTSHSMDVGRVNGQVFVNVASGGYGAMITATTDTEIKRRLGGFAYTLAGLSRLSELVPVTARLQIDDAPVEEFELTFLAIGNSHFAGGGFDVTPQASISDGLLDLAILSPDKLRSLGSDILERIDTSDPASAFVRRSTFKRATLETDAPYHINLDGEPIVGQRFEIEIEPAAVKLVPLASA